MRAKANGHAKPPDDTTLREFLRHLNELEARIEDRHERLITEIRDFRMTALGVIKQRTDLEARLRDVEAKVRRLEEART